MSDQQPKIGFQFIPPPSGVAMDDTALVERALLKYQENERHQELVLGIWIGVLAVLLLLSIAARLYWRKQ